LTDRREQLEPSLIQYVGRELLEALAVAHGHLDADGRPSRLIHRDVTPHNVLVSVDGEVKLTDFGIAKTRESIRTEAGSVRGKLDYLSPEQLLEEPVDARADLFGAALTLFAVAAQRSAFRRDSDSATARAVLADPLPPLAELRPDLPAPLVAALERAASKSAAARFESAQAFRDAIPAADVERSRRSLGRWVQEVCGLETHRLESGTERALASSPSPTQTAATKAERGRGGKGRLARLGLGGAALGAAVLVVLVVREGRRTMTPAPMPRPPELPVALPPAPVAVAPAVVPQPRPPATKPVRHSAEAVGYLTVDAQPWAVVLLDGKRIGETPIDEFPHLEGAVNVRLSCPDTRRSAERRVVLAPGKTTFVNVDLR
jgi:serine/threonine-protein kinase